MSFRSDLSDFDKFKKKIDQHAEKDIAEGLQKGVRRALAGFRKDFMASTDADIQGKTTAGQGPPRRRFRSIGRSISWRMKSNRPVRIKDVGGSISTDSLAALAMEEGATQKPTGDAQNLAIPMLKPGRPNTAPSGKVRRKWRNAEKCMKDATILARYEFFTKSQSNGNKVIMAKFTTGRRKGKTFPAWLLTPEVKQKPIFNWEKTYRRTKRRFSDRISTELSKGLRKWARRRKR